MSFPVIRVYLFNFKLDYSILLLERHAKVIGIYLYFKGINFLRPMEFTIKLDMGKSGWFIIHIERSHVITKNTSHFFL